MEINTDITQGMMIIIGFYLFLNWLFGLFFAPILEMTDMKNKTDITGIKKHIIILLFGIPIIINSMLHYDK